jgi:hypothetical protein
VTAVPFESTALKWITLFKRSLAAAGVLFVVYPRVRLWGDSTPDRMAAAFASPFWLVAHLAAMAAFVLVGAGLTALPGRAALVARVAGTALVLPCYGAEAFALHALAGEPKHRGARRSDPNGGYPADGVRRRPGPARRRRAY